MPDVHFVNLQKLVTVEAGTSLLEAARRSEVILESPCNGEGTCGKCGVKVNLEDRSSVQHEAEHHALSAESEREGWMLGCRAFIHGDVRVVVPQPKHSRLAIVSEGRCRKVPVDPWITKRHDPLSDTTLLSAGDQLLETEPGDTTAGNYGLAVDIGTTTLVSALIDLKNGKSLASRSALNPQALHAQDVLSRIKLGSTPEGLSRLHTDLLQELNRMTGELAAAAGIDRSAIYEAVFSGNTTMLTLAARLSPASLGKFPYLVTLHSGSSVPAGELGLQIADKGSVWFPPVASAYVGGDIVAGVMAADLPRLKGITLFVDIGTNGEMVLAEDGRLTATSTAAGPAFEGMNISCGMRANAGAIEKVELNNGIVRFQTVSGLPAVGLCGSGLMDTVAELVRESIVDRNGRFVKPGSEVFERWKNHLEVNEGRVRLRLSEKVTLNQQDLRQVQLAKAAVRAGIDMMLLSCSLAPEAVDRVFIAGSFGAHLQRSSLVALGLLPELFGDRIEFLGNTSRSGASAFLINREIRCEAAAMVKRMKVLELSREAEFEKIFLQALSFPQSEQKKQKTGT